MIRWFKSSYSDGPDGDSCVEVGLNWFKSSYSSGPDGDSCVEVGLNWSPTPSTIHIRDSKQDDGPRLTVAPSTWTEFVSYAARH
ncbi:DUF397 domain-containing protein [Streptomyces sp. FBKL.4005]|uniref:DUF397 domain-containing protein n=1 Tax=unclassified Streptomyces TaxID=2593676 RepID=UPI000B96C9FF|nr:MULTISPECIES: DUF397 domain-containing protein [unclassified Streptomyces]OYP16862.1 DUF397 domain-containing protein [Streptomyces sp. FBKL.4005]BCM67669.1 hypothetical protein EASAB2608_03003 [Streptomyces sp. EAS-AB2608]